MIIKCRPFNGGSSWSIHIKAFVVVVVLRNKKNKILYHSRLKYFYTRQAADYYINEVTENFPFVEYYWVDVHKAHEIPEDIDEIRKKHLWCPYCQTVNEFKKHKTTGYKHCPICGMSDNDFHVKVMNARYRERGKKK